MTTTNPTLNSLCAGNTKTAIGGLANGNNRGLSPPLFKKVVSTYHECSHDSDRWQSSWHHSTLLHFSFFFASSSPSPSHAFAAIEVCCVLKCWIITHLGRHIAYCKTSRDVWSQGVLSLTILACLTNILQRPKPSFADLFVRYITAKEASPQICHKPSSHSNSQNSWDKCVSESVYLV